MACPRHKRQQHQPKTKSPQIIYFKNYYQLRRPGMKSQRLSTCFIQPIVDDSDSSRVRVNDYHDHGHDYNHYHDHDQDQSQAQTQDQDHDHDHDYDYDHDYHNN